MRRSCRRLVGALVVLAGLCGPDLASPALGNVLYSNLGPGDSFSKDNTYNVRGTVPDKVYSAIGVQFVPTMNGHVGSIDVAFVQDEASSASDILFQLRADDGSDFPDFTLPVLDELVLSGTDVEKDNPALYNVKSTKFPVLTVGTRYWLIASTENAAFFGWNQTDPAIMGNLFVDSTFPPGADGTVSREILATLRVNALSAVPEPSTAVLGTLAMIFGGALTWFRRRDAARTESRWA